MQRPQLGCIPDGANPGQIDFTGVIHTDPRYMRTYGEQQALSFSRAIVIYLNGDCDGIRYSHVMIIRHSEKGKEDRCRPI
jgi:hypothetical protein